MSSLQALIDRTTDRSLRTATFVGAVSVPFTIILSWRSIPSDVIIVTGGTISAGPLFLAGLVTGFLYSDRPTETRRAGIQTGLVGSIGVVAFYSLNTVSTISTESVGLSIVAVALAPIAITIGVGLSIIVAGLGTIIGAWLYEKLSRVRPIFRSN